MERKYSNPEEALNVAKTVIYLAWQACGGPSGYGVLQDQGDQERDKVWDQAFNMKDYSGRMGLAPGYVNADYVFGRMMKLRFTLDGNKITGISDSTPRGDYQGWCYVYKTYDALFDAAEKTVIEKLAA